MREPLIPITEELQQAIEKGVVVTATSRQAQELRYSWSHKQILGGNLGFVSPRIYDFDGWLVSAYEELDRLGVEGGNWSLLRGAALNLAFQVCAPDEEFVKHSAAVVEAWRIYVEWNLSRVKPDLKVTENGRVFVRWIDAFQEFCEERQLLTIPELPGLITNSVTNQTWKPEKISLFAVREKSPRRRELLTQLRQFGCDVIDIEPEHRFDGEVVKIGFESLSRELSTITGWAREQFSTLPINSRIGIVCPHIGELAQQIKRSFEATFWDCHSIDSIVHIGSGVPLRETRLCQDVIKFLEWTVHPLDYSEVIQLGRSPFLPELEIPEVFTNSYHERFDLHYYLSKQNKELKTKLQSLSFLRGNHNRSINEWVDLLVQALKVLGWENHKDVTVNQQARTEVLQVFSEVIKLSPLVGEIKWSFFVSLARVSLLQHTMKSESRFTPIQVVSREQSVGMQFDALWVLGNADTQWPPPMQPNAMIPLPVQREAQVHRVTYPNLLDWAQNLTDLWSKSAPKVIFSYVDEEQEDIQAEVAVSQLLATFPEASLSTLIDEPGSVSHDHPWARHMQDENYINEYFSDFGTKIPQTDTHFSTSILRNQSKCPFRAWGIHRIGIKDHQAPYRFPDAIERGNILHALIQEFLEIANNQIGISKLTEEVIAEVISKVLAERLDELPRQFVDQEQERLKKIVNQWMEFECDRTPFEVLEVEKSHEIGLGGVSMRYKIDRVDKLDDGSVLVIDLKTGNVNRGDWRLPRLGDTQMPLYATAVPDCKGLVYLLFNRGKPNRFMGYGELETAIKGIDGVSNKFKKSWDEVKQAWKVELENLIKRYFAGDAHVDPVHPNVCSYCHLMSFCRQFEDTTFITPPKAPTSDV
ncbi:MAG: PD-(D/E)XK nuclease family protein [Gammaproteobacteria bacterium]|nr:PD-(D/E)XK nuclease family protein [Gammaproteobacteria bacterium]MDE0402138.1 PD-(D/E)XK nuclease family protein [Gammaproteobacteria bacterium]